MRRADVLIVAAGVAGLIGRDDVREGAAVIDVGIHRVGGRLRGDVRFDELIDHASHVTPVPGGVGPMTIAELLRNTLQAARLQATSVN
jgi:methylenetetrahydrofolate dehydrogenase (NADP+)/methenyltetrahydrofolate cyclohydrolase